MLLGLFQIVESQFCLVNQWLRSCCLRHESGLSRGVEMPLHLTVLVLSLMALNSKLVFDLLDKRTLKIPIDLALLFHQ